jgi:3-methyladenine DNA glycosylase Tag
LTGVSQTEVLVRADIERLLSDPWVVRSRAKIEATVDNAQALIERGAEHGGFDQYAHSHGDFENTVRDLKRQFRVIGDSGAYHFPLGSRRAGPLSRDHRSI